MNIPYTSTWVFDGVANHKLVCWVCPGILPDVMHLVHLGVATDVVVSLLLDWSDDTRFFGESSREKRLNQMWDSYRQWCESQGYSMSDRAGRKLFSTAKLKPDGSGYTEISQKVMNASACRYIVFWLQDLAKQFAGWSDSDEDMNLTCAIVKSFVFWVPPLNLKHVHNFPLTTNNKFSNCLYKA